MSRRSLARAKPVSLLVVVLLGAAPRFASAQSAADVAAARAFFIEGTKMGNEGRWTEAQELYTKSLLRKPAAITRYSLGVAQKETGHLVDALSSFRAFLAEPLTPATAPYAPAAAAAIVELEGRTGRVTILIEPRPIGGLTLAIDGQPAPAVSDGTHEIEPGSHEVVARAPGFRGALASFNVAAGGVATVKITLTPEKAAVVPPPPVAPRRTLPFVLIGSGAALFTGGAALGLVGVAQASHTPTRKGADASAARAKGIAGDVLCGAGIASATAGLILLATQGRSAPPTTGAARISIRGSASGIGVQF